MTYWYPGVTAAIRLAKEHFPGVPVILGGIYASLCPDHARASERRRPGPPRPLGNRSCRRICRPSWVLALPPSNPADLDALPYPALDLGHRAYFIPHPHLPGLPLYCAYCASRLHAPRYRRRCPPGRGGGAGCIGSRPLAFRRWPFMMMPSWCRPPTICSPSWRNWPAGAHASASIPPTACMPAYSPGSGRVAQARQLRHPAPGGGDRRPGERPPGSKNSRRGELEAALSLPQGSGLSPEGHRRLPADRPAGANRRGGGGLHPPGAGNWAPPRSWPSTPPSPAPNSGPRPCAVLPLRPGTRTPVPQQLAVSLLAHLLLGALHPPETPGPGFVVVVCSLRRARYLSPCPTNL